MNSMQLIGICVRSVHMAKQVVDQLEGLNTKEALAAFEIVLGKILDEEIEEARSRPS